MAPDDARRTAALLEAEHVTFQQLLTVITDDDLVDVGVSSAEHRDLILSKAQAISKAYAVTARGGTAPTLPHWDDG